MLLVLDPGQDERHHQDGDADDDGTREHGEDGEVPRTDVRTVSHGPSAHAKWSDRVARGAIGAEDLQQRGVLPNLFERRLDLRIVPSRHEVHVHQVLERGTAARP